MTQLDLESCQNWSRFLEIHCDRISKDEFFGHKEVIMLFIRVSPFIRYMVRPTVEKVIAERMCQLSLENAGFHTLGHAKREVKGNFLWEMIELSPSRPPMNSGKMIY